MPRLGALPKSAIVTALSRAARHLERLMAPKKLEICRRLLRISRAFAPLLLCFGVIAAQLFDCRPVNADETEFPPIERRFVMGSSWLISLHTSTLDNLLNYPGSAIHPVTQVRVMFFTREARSQNWGKGKIYEDLWFTSGKPIGCRRHMSLPIQPGSYGTIYVARTKDCASQTKALDNTILRLFVELYRGNSIITSVVLPAEICENASTDLGSFNFLQAAIITTGRTMMLHFQSSPMGFDRYFTYTVK